MEHFISPGPEGCFENSLKEFLKFERVLGCSESARSKESRSLVPTLLKMVRYCSTAVCYFWDMSAYYSVN